MSKCSPDSGTHLFNPSPLWPLPPPTLWPLPPPPSGPSPPIPTSCKQSEVSSLTEQAGQQSDYWACMGVTCCSMLWRLSQNDESVSTLLSGVRECSTQCMHRG